ncbi:hypothetical protein [Antribacter gilvus]|uniref:hypothetical protein n=1 Tax=Antribacter gilvus TaxID=2304675 RepID=UPI000F76709B|nr:hypothetical protein [Antribacter gilvus]
MIAALATAAWVSWGVGYQYGGLVYGSLLGLGVVGASLVLGAGWRKRTRIVVAIAIAAASATAALVVLTR